ncbi:son of sevenless homolog 2-like isoform X2 [Brevipalpus obovatus]|uniref:son of sevenless homolog 2-like isoform X2 n=1 Tax=Brevipalpus obovatus TaxID=246614 RepID=UPI003D9DD5FA
MSTNSMHQMMYPYYLQILYSHYPQLSVDDEALLFIESLILKLIRLLISNTPHSVHELEERLVKVFPDPFDRCITSKANLVLQECYDVQCNLNSLNSSLSNNSLVGKKKKLLLVNIPNNNNNMTNAQSILSNCSLVMTPIIEKMHDLLSKDVFQYRIDLAMTIYLCTLVEYIANDVLKLAGHYVTNIRHDKIHAQDVRIAINADKSLIDLLYGEEEEYESRQEFSNLSMIMEETTEEGTDDEGITYETVVKELVQEEKHFIKDLNFIIKVFRDPLIKILNSPASQPNTPTSPTSFSDYNSQEKSLITQEDVDAIMSNILEIHEFSVDFLGQIEDAMEMNGEEDSDSVGIGICFLEKAEEVEFECFERYFQDMFRIEEGTNITVPQARLNSLLEKQSIIRSLDTAGHKFPLSVKYILPKLLMRPIVHYLSYLDYIRLLKSLARADPDKESFEQAEGLMRPLCKKIEASTKGKNLKLNEGVLRLNKGNQWSKHKRKIFLNKIDELKKNVEGLSDFNSYECNEFIFESKLLRKNERKTLGRHENKFFSSERYCYLFDTMLLACKPTTRENNSIQTEHKLKEKIVLTKFEIVESDLDSCAFELVNTSKSTNFESNRGNITFLAKNLEEKNIWMGNILLLIRKSTFDRMLDSMLAEEEKKYRLRLPDPSIYMFAESDTSDNIIFETNCGKKSLLKGATLNKLIERLTYHQAPEGMFGKIFLCTYRSFCTPKQLLELLIKRFDIPDWKESQIPHAEKKKFKKEYREPVQFRVINVIKQWIDAHYYDFENDPALLEMLHEFLQSKVSKEKNLAKWVQTLSNMIQRKSKSSSKAENKILPEVPPPIEFFYAPGKDNNEFELNLMTVHPLEFARQLTLYEFDLYCAVQPYELIGLKWVKEGKEVNSANLLKISEHSTRYTYWLEKEIVETKNFEERVALVSRICEIMQVLSDLNNFNGIIETLAALGSACVHRLQHTMNSLPLKHRKLIEEMSDLNKDHYKKYCERLRSINPPCVPFSGLYQTQILHFEEGNSDFIDVDRGIINFSKRRKIAEITTEIQGYQNQPYCLLVCPEIRDFIEKMNPFEEHGNEKDLNDYLYDQSMTIEPRDSKQPTKGPKRWPNLPTLKSPGIKPSSSHNHSHPTSLPISTSMISYHHPQSTSSSNPTSPTLISPKTPPSTTSDTSVFANVIINPNNQPPTPSPFTDKISFTDRPMSSSNSGSISTPPPIPPRSKNFHQRTQSESSTSPSSTTPLGVGAFSFNFMNNPQQPPPPPPPRITRPPPSAMSHQSSNSLSSPSADHQTPPPLPPRGISPHPQTSQSFRQTLPRRNSTETQPHDIIPNSFHRRNSSSSSTHSQPQLPPKTYRAKR